MRHAILLALAALILRAETAAAQTVHVLPYVQPGDGSKLSSADTKVICWMTDQVPGEFTVEYSANGAPVRIAKHVAVKLDFPALKVKVLEVAPPPREVVNPKPKAKDKDPNDLDEPKEPKVPLPPERDQHYLNYAAVLDDLPFNCEVTYRVKLAGKVIREAAFRTRATADKTVRCVLVGDLAQGRPAQKTIAHHIWEEKPEFLVALGDIVYPSGRANQYAAFYWDTYNNVSAPSLKSGAPLMASIPFYPILGNHDIAAKLSTTPDALAVYYFFHVPKNGPGEGPWATPIGTDEAAKKFRGNSWGNYPAIDAYSFDYGPAHFAVINDNAKLAIDNPVFVKWLRADLLATTAKWKFVCYHVPGFQAARQHYTEQQARQLQPVFEECGVDITFSGHVHNYQRSVPLLFTPDDKGIVKGKLNGQFTLDFAFDGIKVTKPKGVIHIVAGGGGASLYGPSPEKVAEGLKKLHGDNLAPFTAKAVVEQHSFVVLDLSPERLSLRAVGIDGKEIDSIAVEKGK
jgi:predicted phosphodiesterase